MRVFKQSKKGDCDFASAALLLLMKHLSNRQGFTNDPCPDVLNDKIVYYLCNKTRKVKLETTYIPFKLLRQHTANGRCLHMRVCAHRGASYYEPENTLRAFKRALEMGAYRLELDVRSTKDGIIVVIHDDTVDRTTNGSGFVREMTLKEIKRLDAGKGEKIPTLEEVLEFAKNNAKLLVDVKEKGLEEKLAELVRAKGMVNDVVFISSTHIIRDLKKINQELQVCPYYRFVADEPLNMKRIKELDANWIYVSWMKISKDLVNLLHENSIKIFVGVPDILEVEEFRRIVKRLSNIEVDEIVTGRPDLASTYASTRDY